jgi:hypothetical protein
MVELNDYKEFNGKTVKLVQLEDYDVTKKVLVVYFTDETKMRVEIEAKGNGWDFEELSVDVYEL